MTSCQKVRLIVQIKKISDDKLKVILNSHDLLQKNMDVDTFLSNSIESQNLFFEILDLAEQEYSFSIENHKAIIEAISLDNNVFILTITRVKNDFKFTHFTSDTVYCFENIDYFLSAKHLLKKIAKENTFLYEWNHQYFFILPPSLSCLKDLLLEYAIPIKIPYFSDFILEHGKKIRER